MNGNEKYRLKSAFVCCLHRDNASWHHETINILKQDSNPSNICRIQDNVLTPKQQRSCVVQQNKLHLLDWPKSFTHTSVSGATWLESHANRPCHSMKHSFEHSPNKTKSLQYGIGVLIYGRFRESNPDLYHPKVEFYH